MTMRLELTPEQVDILHSLVDLQKHMTLCNTGEHQEQLDDLEFKLRRPPRTNKTFDSFQEEILYLVGSQEWWVDALVSRVQEKHPLLLGADVRAALLPLMSCGYIEFTGGGFIRRKDEV